MDTILLFTDLCSGSRIPTLRGARAAAAEHDLQVQVVELARVKVPLAKTLAFWKPVGCLIEGSSHIRPSSPLLKKLPGVHIDPNAKILATKPAFTVRNDNAGIAERAIKVLLRAGVEHFAFVGWTRDVNWSTDRYETFRETLAALGKDCAALLDPWTMGNAADFIARLKPWLLKLPKPCGLFAANDDIATVVLDACRAAGLCVPDDIAVIGVDDEPSVCEATKPSLSSVRPDFERAGRLAVDLLVRRLAQPELAEEHILFPVAGVTLRQSTRHLAQPNAKILAALEFIRREATHGLKAADVVAFLGLSERLAETRFKAATGHRITEEITEVRLAHALERLRDPQQALGPIANLCGWDSDIYLKRLFKARYGLTMSQWRKKHSI